MKDGKSKITGLSAKSMMGQAKAAETSITTLKVKRSEFKPTAANKSSLKARKGKLS